MNPLAAREALLQRATHSERRYINGWESDVLIRRFSVADMHAMRARSNNDSAEAQVDFVIRSLVNEDGSPLFPGGDEDRSFLLRQDVAVIEEIVLAIAEVNGFAKPAGDLAKN